MLTTRQIRALILVGIVVGATTVGYAGALFVIEDPVRQSGTVPYQTNSGVTVNVVGATNTSSGNPFPDDETVVVETAEGTATFSGAGDANLTVAVEDLEGEWTNVTAVNTTANDVTIDPDDKRAVTIGGEVDEFRYRQSISAAEADDGEVDFVYNGSSGNTEVTITNLPPSIAIDAVDLDTGTVLDAATTTDDGDLSLTMPNSEHRVDLRTSENAAPSLSAASPRGNTYIDNRSGVELAFTPQDDTSDQVNYTVKALNSSGSFETVATGQAATGSEETVTTTALRGANEWFVELEDEEGLNATSPTFRYRAAGSLFVFDDDDDTLLDGQTVTATISATEGSFQTTRTTTDGEIDLQDIDDQEYVIELSASGYHNRTRVVSSPAGNYSTLLYNESTAGTFGQTFSLDDRTGFFPPDETQLVFQERIDGNYTTTTSNYFGPNNRAEFTLIDQREYRIIVRNKNGDRRSLGGFIANESQSDVIIEIVVGDFTPDDEREETALYTWSTAFVDKEGADPYLSFKFNLTNESVVAEDFRLKIYEYGNESNVIFENDYGLVQSVNHNQALTEEQTGSRWAIQWNATINGEERGGTNVVGAEQSPLLTELDPIWKQAAGFMIIMLTAGLWSRVNRGTGAVVTAAVAGIVWYIGFLGGVGSAGAIAAAIVIGLFQKATEPTGQALP